MRRCGRLLSTSPSSAVISFYDKTVEQFASRKAQQLSVREAMNHCAASKGVITEKQLIISARFLQREMPIRMAWTMRDFQTLPYIVGVNPHINRLYRNYWHTFIELTKQCNKPIRTADDEREFTDVLTGLLRLNQNAISEVSPGIAEVRMLPNSARIDFAYIDRFLTTFITERLARRTMASFHQALHLAFWNKQLDRDWIGCFHTKCSPSAVVSACFQVVSQISTQIYGRAPKLRITGDTTATFTYVPILLENILYEIFKNSMRAVHEQYPNDPKAPLPDITVKICAGKEMTIVVSDRGGGIPVGLQDLIWGFGFSTHQPESFDVEEYRVNFRSGEETDTVLQFAGFGFGLPMARTFVRYLGGEIIVHSLLGYGTDVYIHMPDPTVGNIASELRGGN